MDTRPAVPGNDAATSGFEGFANKEADKGGPIFAAKNEPQAAPGNGSLPPGATETAPYPVKKAAVQDAKANPTPGYPVRPKVSATTSAGFLKSIGD